ncbi:hypothetical protein BGY98DRAFT_83840 [Russula aff. rugulosa BPL654]|nr:hypothetical protein BGY98DRAFT_83840 [Russula aff. rugulosa BPL654]
MNLRVVTSSFPPLSFFQSVWIARPLRDKLALRYSILHPLSIRHQSKYQEETTHDDNALEQRDRASTAAYPPLHCMACSSNLQRLIMDGHRRRRFPILEYLVVNCQVLVGSGRIDDLIFFFASETRHVFIRTFRWWRATVGVLHVCRSSGSVRLNTLVSIASNLKVASMTWDGAYTVL